MTSYVRHIIYGKMTVFSPRCIYAYLLILLYGLAVTSCGDSKRTVYEKAIIEWTGKEIIFPDSMRLVGGGMIAKPETDFTIVSYYDSVGCTGCRMKLNFWLRLMETLDSYSPHDISLILISAPQKEKSLRDIANDSRFKHSIVFDKNEEFAKINRLPNKPILRTFLLDSQKHVILMGNPIEIPELAKSYLKAMDVDSDIIDRYVKMEHSYDFGYISPGDSVCHVFTLFNNSTDTLRVKNVESSCGCTEGRVYPTTIPPMASYRSEIWFCDTTAGNFRQYVSISFEGNIPENLIEVSGEIKNILTN